MHASSKANKSPLLCSRRKLAFFLDTLSDYKDASLLTCVIVGATKSLGRLAAIGMVKMGHQPWFVPCVNAQVPNVISLPHSCLR